MTPSYFKLAVQSDTLVTTNQRDQNLLMFHYYNVNAPTDQMTGANKTTTIASTHRPLGHVSDGHRSQPFRSQLAAKLFASSGFRRRSYDDQEGDNDFNIILQPSDIEDIERRARAKYAQNSQAKQEQQHQQTPSMQQQLQLPNRLQSQLQLHRHRRFKNNHQRRPASKPAALDNIFEDIKLAKCLLDQDYKQTVRLFIQRSALNWNFNSFTFDALCCGRSLTELLLHLFDYYDLYATFSLDIIKVLKCCRLLEFGYHSTNPYHNSVHAADVTQAMHCFIQERKIRQHLTSLEILCAILAAVCHDLDHPGVNQSFLVATKNPLASLYGNTSVLENHHWRFALCIFRESQLFDHLDSATLADMKDQLKQLILATDIARQNEYLKRFRELTSSRQFSMSNTTDRALVLQMALKCADLGNPCRPWMISRVWSNLICDEFYRMGQVEQRLGVPLTPICQREKTSIAGIQTDFFRFIVLPLLELWHGFLSSPLSNVLMANFDHNYKRWQRASRIVQQMRRRKSVACLEPVTAGQPPDRWADVGLLDGGSTLTTATKRRRASLFADPLAEDIYARHTFAAIKRASSDYIKSGNGRLEVLRDFQLNRAIERSPHVQRAHKRHIVNLTAAAACNTESPGLQQPKAVLSCRTTAEPNRRAMRDCPFRQLALSPIQDGESPEQQQQQQQDRTCTMAHKQAHSPISSASSTSSVCSSSSSSSRCQNRTAKRRLEQQTKVVAGHNYHQHGADSTPSKQNLANRQTAATLSMTQTKSFYNNARRRESDPGALTDELTAAALVLIQYQSSTLFHKRRSSLPICVPRRRSSK